MDNLRLLAACLCLSACAHGAPLTVLVDTGTEMPLAQIVNGELVDGIHKDLGVALARELKRAVRYRILPRNRVAEALARGEADIMCMYVPEWLPGPFLWSRPFFPYAEVIVTARRVPQPGSLASLAGQKIATVLGYRHPEIEEVLGERFVREDGPSAETNLRKMVAGRLDHVIGSNLYIQYRLHHGTPPLDIHEPLVVKTMRLSCALSRASGLQVAEVNRAIAQIVKDDTLDRILRRYQQ